MQRKLATRSCVPLWCGLSAYYRPRPRAQWLTYLSPDPFRIKLFNLERLAPSAYLQPVGCPREPPPTYPTGENPGEVHVSCTLSGSLLKSLLKYRALRHTRYEEGKPEPGTLETQTQTKAEDSHRRPLSIWDTHKADRQATGQRRGPRPASLLVSEPSQPFLIYLSRTHHNNSR